MRRSICICEPNIAIAGSVGQWKFIYTTSTPLPKGARLKFDLGSKGRDIDWQTPTADLKKKHNIIYAELEDGQIFGAKEIETDNSLVPQFEFVLPVEVSAGSSISIVMGSVDSSDGGNASQRMTQRRRPFFLHVDPSGKGKYEETETFFLDLRGGKLDILRILTPSFVVKNKRFDVIIRFEDSYGNLTSRAPEETLIELSYENLRENLSWKLFVPETGFIMLPNLYFNEVGVYRIQLRNMLTGQLFYSYPIKCFAETNYYLFWGLLHGESERVDSTENIESCLRHFRDERSLNFFASSPFESADETPADVWKKISNSCAEFNEEDRFAVFLGFQFPGDEIGEGLRQIIYRKEAKAIYRKKDSKTSSVKKIYKSTLPKELISIPSFTMGPDNLGCNFEDFTPEFEQVVEIYNAWGSSECTEEEGNPRPIVNFGKKAIKPYNEGSIRRALNRNCRFGFVAGGLDDRDVYAGFFEGDYAQYSPGITAIIADKHCRESLFDALYARSCYATTGERIIVGFFLAGIPMGGETDTATKPGLVINRHLSGYVAGTEAIASVEIIRNGKVLKTFSPDSAEFEFTYDDMDTLSKIVLDAQDSSLPFVYYYLRVIQKNEHMAWSSPIWVDYIGKAQPTVAAKKTKKS